MKGNPTLYSTLLPRTLPCSVSQSSRPCHAPAPSERISNLLRWVAGTWAIASLSTSMWSAVVFDPALPARSLAARNSTVLSHQTPIGW